MGETHTSTREFKSEGQERRAELDLGTEHKANWLKEKPVKVSPRHLLGDAARRQHFTGGWKAQVGITERTISGPFSRSILVYVSLEPRSS